MDLYCTRCGEPWDNDCIHEEVDARNASGETAPGGVTTYAQVATEFRRHGCVAFRVAFGAGQCEARPGTELRAAIYDMLGDDMDGAASMFDDAEAMGLL